MLGLDGKGNQTSGHVDSKKLFQFLKNSRTDQQAIFPLKRNDQLHTDTKNKANMLNEQFQSAFVPLSPLSLKGLSLMKVQALADKNWSQGIWKSNPSHVRYHIISDIGISKLLKKLNPRKATGPDKIKPVVLRELREELVPIIENTLWEISSEWLSSKWLESAVQKRWQVLCCQLSANLPYMYLV